jgi:hypothetical protein
LYSWSSAAGVVHENLARLQAQLDDGDEEDVHALIAHSERVNAAATRMRELFIEAVSVCALTRLCATCVQRPDSLAAQLPALEEKKAQLEEQGE